MARRIRWQIVIATFSGLLIVGLLSRVALMNTAVSSPLTGGTYVEAIIGVPSQPIPLLNDPLLDPAGRDLAALLFDGLTRIGIDGLPEPALAESWQVDPGGEVYIFNLRRDVTWHDGAPFTATDVIFTLQTIQEASFTGDAALANLWRNVLVDRLDDYTIRCTLSAPYAPFLSAVRVPIMPAHLLGNISIDQWSTSPYAQQLVGTGPYQLEELALDRAILTANDTYFQRRPFIDRIELRFIETPEAALSALARDDVQALGFSITPTLGQVALPRTVRPMTVPLDGYTLVTFNLRNPPLDDQALRQALAGSLNKDTLIEQVLGGQVARIDTPILPGWWAYDPSVAWYDYDPAMAAQVLDEQGYVADADGMRMYEGAVLALPLITDSDPGRVATAEYLARQWTALGIQVEVEVLESAELRQRLRDHDFALALHSWSRLGADPDVFALWHSSQASSGLNYAGLRDETIDRVLVSARTELDLGARNSDYRTFQERWVQVVPAIILYQPLYTFATSEQLGGSGLDGRDIDSPLLLIGREDRYRNITRWFVESSRELRGTLR